MPRPAQERPYHHGDLRRALVDEAVRALEEDGSGVLSLRDLARRVGVSHAAPQHHFRDKTGLLVAVAAEGFHLLTEELRLAYEQSDEFLDVGVAYVNFAVRHRPYFEVMFRPDLYRSPDPELAEARDGMYEVLYAAVRRVRLDASDDEIAVVGAAAWSAIHGVATLLLTGGLPARLGRDPGDVTRAFTAHLFAE
jgi:AcrR family transcriptional regulator